MVKIFLKFQYFELGLTPALKLKMMISTTTTTMKKTIN